MLKDSLAAGFSRDNKNWVLRLARTTLGRREYNRWLQRFLSDCAGIFEDTSIIDCPCGNVMMLEQLEIYSSLGTSCIAAMMGRRC